MREQRYQRGQLVYILTENREYTQEGFMAIGHGLYHKGSDAAILFERIDLSKYPSCNDFHGKETVVSHGDLATVLSYVGRPSQIRDDPSWDIYDVYEVLVNGKICHTFKWNLSEALLLAPDSLLLP